MRIDLRNLERRRLFRAEVDEKARPALIRSPDGHLEHFLDWDQAIDDQGHLRRCPACGCPDLFARQSFPQVTGFAIIVLAALASMVLLGMRQALLAVVVLAAVALVDAAIFLFSKRCLVCYRCHSEYRRVPIRRDHSKWDPATGDKYRRPAQRSPADPPQTVSPDKVHHA